MTQQLIARLSVGLFVTQTLLMCFSFLAVDLAQNDNMVVDFEHEEVAEIIDFSLDNDLCDSFQILEEELEEEYKVDHPNTSIAFMIKQKIEARKCNKKGSVYIQIPYSPPDYC